MTKPHHSSLTDRRNPLKPARQITVFDDRIEWTEGDSLIRRIGLSQVQTVRLSVEMAGQQTQVVCRVAGLEGEIIFGSRSAVKPGVWEDNALQFRALLVTLHEALRSRFDTIAFIEGQTLGFRLSMCTGGALMAGAAIIFSGWMLTYAQSPMLSLAGLPFAVLGGYLAWLFRPGRPEPYDPETLIARFSTDTDQG